MMTLSQEIDQLDTAWEALSDEDKTTMATRGDAWVIQCIVEGVMGHREALLKSDGIVQIFVDIDEAKAKVKALNRRTMNCYHEAYTRSMREWG